MQNINVVIRYMKEDGFAHKGIEHLVDLHPICVFIEIILKIFFLAAGKKKMQLNLKDWGMHVIFS
jgi:hypothetical protein